VWSVLDITQINALFEQWEQEPHISQITWVIAQYLGVKRPASTIPKRKLTPDDNRRQAEELAGMFGLNLHAMTPGAQVVVR
jgi:hypothetical protein